MRGEEMVLQGTVRVAYCVLRFGTNAPHTRAQHAIRNTDF